MGLLEQIVNETTGITPVATIDGVQVYTFDDAQKLNARELTESKITGQKVELGERKLTADGMGYTSSMAKNVAVDPGQFYDNRIHQVDDTIEVVTDYRAIQEQPSGRVYTNNVPVYVLVKDGKQWKIETTKTINADDFVRDFKEKLNNDSMKTVKSLIEAWQSTDTVKAVSL